MWGGAELEAIVCPAVAMWLQSSCPRMRPRRMQIGLGPYREHDFILS